MSIRQAQLRTIQAGKVLYDARSTAVSRGYVETTYCDEKRTGASNTMGMYRKCSYSRIVSVCRGEFVNSNIESTPLSRHESYHTEQIDNDDIDMWARRLVCNLERIVDAIRPESEFLYPVHHSCLFIHCVNE